MRIHIPLEGTPTVLRTDKQAYLKYRSPDCSNGLAAPFDSVVWSDWQIYPYEDPIVGPDQKRGTNLIETAGVYTYEVIDLTAQELADRAANQIQADLQSATIASAILIQEVFTQLKDAGYLNVVTLSQDAKDQFSTLSALVAQYNA